jgi:hypothetical protein
MRGQLGSKGGYEDSKLLAALMHDPEALPALPTLLVRDCWLCCSYKQDGCETLHNVYRLLPGSASCCFALRVH